MRVMADTADTRRERFTVLDGGRSQSNSSMQQSRVRNDEARLRLVSERLADIAALPEGWDGYGADKVSSSTISFSAMLLGRVWDEARALPSPAITAMSSGAIMIEWRSPSHELTLEVNAPNDIDMMFEDLATGQTRVAHATSNFAQISAWLEEGTRTTPRAIA